jgi:hypothetical protein
LWKMLAIATEALLGLGAMAVLSLWAHLVRTMHRSGKEFSRRMAQLRAGRPGTHGTERASREAGAADAQPAARHRVASTDAHRSSGEST